LDVCALRRKRCPLKHIIAISVATFYYRHRARRQIGKRKNHAPAFVLAHMRVFVDAQPCGGGAIACQDDVAESDRFNITPGID